MLWQVSSYPDCTHHVFLSHCREDRDSLVLPVFERLQARGIVPWLDQQDYPGGRAELHALRDSMLKCRHVVFFVTENMIRQRRGWTVVELVYAELLQESLCWPGGVLQHVALPLFLFDFAKAQEHLVQSVWHLLEGRRVAYSGGEASPVDWATDQIGSYLSREESFGRDMLGTLEHTPNLRDHVSNRPGLEGRITVLSPPSV